MNNNSLINNIYINILYVENSFSKKAMVSRNILKKFGGKKTWLHSPSPPHWFCKEFGFDKTDATHCETACAWHLVMAVGECGRDEGGWKGNDVLLSSLPAPSLAVR